MLRPRLAICFAVFTLAGCAQSPAPGAASTAANGGLGSPSASGAATAAGSAAPGSAVPSATAAPGSRAPNIEMLAPGEVRLTTATPQRIASQLILERQQGDAWRTVAMEAGAFRAIAACNEAPAACTDLSPDKPLVVVPLTGLSCGAQCSAACDKNAWLGPGSFRVRAMPCPDAPALFASVATPPFELPSSDFSGPAFARWKLTERIETAHIMRVSDLQDGPAAPAAKAIAGYPITSAAPLQLTAVLQAQLAALLRNPRGFKDDIKKRCLESQRVGLRLARVGAGTYSGTLTTTPAGPTTTIEIVLGFGCNSVRAKIEGSENYLGVGGYFDPSRAAFLAFAKAALPNDKELAALR